jgi:hypothetical protein
MGQHLEKAFGWAALVAIAAMAGWLMGMAPAVAASPSARTPPASQPMSPLDLRAPAAVPAPMLEAEQQPSDAFPSLIRRAAAGAAVQRSFSLGESEAAEIHGPPSMADLALRIHREGLPLVRLWQGNSALVHLGLNAKGKPGLWLLQKTH